MNKKKFFFIITGNMIMSVSAINNSVAEEKAEAYLVKNCPMRAWEIYSEAEEADINETDLDI